MISEKDNLFNPKLTQLDILRSIKDYSTISAKIVAFNPKSDDFIKCKLSNKVYGMMPLKEFDPNLKKLYDHLGNPFYPQIDRLKNSNVSVIVTEQISDDTFMISRRKNIEKCYRFLKEEKKITVCVTGNNKEFIFVDCGMGVNGKIYLSELSNDNISCIEDANVKINDSFEALILSWDDKHFRFVLSKRRISNTIPEVNQIMNCIIRTPIKNSKSIYGDERYSSFFVEMLPSHSSGIINAKFSDDLKYGDKVEAFVYKVNSKGQCKLSFIRKL